MVEARNANYATILRQLCFGKRAGVVLEAVEVSAHAVTCVLIAPTMQPFATWWVRRGSGCIHWQCARPTAACALPVFVMPMTDSHSGGRGQRLERQVSAGQGKWCGGRARRRLRLGDGGARAAPRAGAPVF